MAAIFDSFEDKALVKLINSGSIGVIPTDTVYGLVCRADKKTSVAGLYKLKNRDKKPGTVVAGNIEQLVSLGIKRRYLKAVEQFWPGEVSVVLPDSNVELAYLRQGADGIAVRIPKDKSLTKLLLSTGPLLTTSANKAGEDPAQNIEQAGLYFGGTVDFYVDGGNMKNRQPSTLIRIIDDEIEVLREGSVKIKDNKVVKK